eukprot:5290217-Pyramimonas_sp.AAC.1
MATYGIRIGVSYDLIGFESYRMLWCSYRSPIESGGLRIGVILDLMGVVLESYTIVLYDLLGMCIRGPIGPFGIRIGIPSGLMGFV